MYIYPNSYFQDSTQSVCTSNGLYDFDKLSMLEIHTITEVLSEAFSDTYTEKMHGLGLLNECYSLAYKERYILMDLITELFDKSNNAYDALAVAEAYRFKGAAFREKAIIKYEQYLQNTNFLQREKINSTFAIFSNRLIYHNLSELYEKEHNLFNALKYAELAEKHNNDYLPLYPIHISAILIKIEPVKAVQYLKRILIGRKYKKHKIALKEALSEAKAKADRGYRYVPRKRKTQIADIDIAINRAARKFLQSGEYFHLWHK